MNNTTLILLAAGNSTRFAHKAKKQWLYVGDTPLWLKVARDFECYNFAKIVIVSSANEINYMQNFADFSYVVGGDSRQESLKNAMQYVDTEFVMVSDVARCCIDHEMISRIIAARELGDCIVPAININDTVYISQTPANRDEIKIIQTPQLSVTKLLKNALNSSEIYTDDSSAIAANGGAVHFVQGSLDAHKLTTQNDLNKIPCLKLPSMRNLIGFGIDTHTFEQNKQMVLCGVEIKSSFGLKAHSDGDAAIHAIIDAILGAAGMGDIGEYFPDTSEVYKGADSKELLKSVVGMINSFGLEINNIDITIIAQAPKISPHKLKMRTLLSKLLGIETQFVNIKATTSENVGFIGRSEGLSVHAVALLTYINWSNN